MNLERMKNDMVTTYRNNPCNKTILGLAHTHNRSVRYVRLIMLRAGMSYDATFFDPIPTKALIKKVRGGRIDSYKTKRKD